MVWIVHRSTFFAVDANVSWAFVWLVSGFGFSTGEADGVGTILGIVEFCVSS